MIRRIRKVIVIGLVLGAVLFVASVLLLPWLLSGRLGTEIVVRILETAVNGTVTVDRLEVAWTGEQVVHGLHVETTDGTPVADVDVAVRANLLALLRGGVERWTIGIEGRVDVERREDGSWPLAELLATPSGGSGALPAAPVTLSFDHVSLRMRDRVADHELELREVTGFVEAARAAPLEVSLHARSDADGIEGSITVEGSVRDCVDADGGLSIDGASMTLEVRGESIPVLVAGQLVTVEHYHLDAQSDDLGRQIDVKFGGSARVADTGSEWEAELSVTDFRDASGRLSLGPEQLSGRIVGRQVPVVLLRAALGTTVVDVDRDLGPSVDVELEAKPAPDREISLTAATERVQLELHGAMDPDDEIWRGDRLRIAGTADPELLAAIGPLRAEKPVDFVFEAESFTVPRTEDGGLSLAGVGGRGSLAVAAPVIIDVGRPLTVERLETGLEATTLADGLRLRGSARLDDAPLTFDQSVTRLFDESGRLTAGSVRPIGRIECDDLPPGWIARFAPEYDGAVQQLLGSSAAALLVTSEDDDGALVLDLRVESDVLDVTLVTVPRPADDAVEVRKGVGHLPVTPELLAYLRGDVPGVVVLAAPTAVTIEVEPFVLAVPTDDAAAPPVAFKFDFPAAPGVLGGPVEKPVVLSAFSGHGEVRRGAVPSLAVAATLDVQEDAEETPTLGRIAFDLDFSNPLEAPSLTGWCRFEDVDVAAVERVIGNAPGTLTHWTGAHASVELRTVDRTDDSDAQSMQVHAAFDHFDASLGVVITDETVEISSEPFAVTVPAKELNAMLAEDPAAERPPIASDLPLTATIRKLVLPRARGAELDVSAMDVHLAGGPVQVAGATSTAVVDEIDVDVRRPERGGTLELKGRARATLTGGESGTVSFDFRLPPPTSESDQSVAARYELDAQADRMPTVVPDELLDLGGLLVAAVGPELTVTISSSPGQEKILVTSERGTVDVRAETRGSMLVTPEGESLHAELALTPELCEQLLCYIHPILAGIASAEAPMRLAMSNVTLPMDGDLTKLNGDVTVEIGAVQFRAEAGLLAPIDDFTEQVSGQATTRTVPGRVRTISARINAGVITYERFTINIGEYTLNYTGTIDLVQQRIDIRTEVPVGALDGVIQNIPIIPTGIIVPVRNHGPFTNVATDVEVGGLITNLPGSLLGKVIGGGQHDED